MASEEQRDGDNGSRPVKNDSALSIKTAGGTEVVFNDVWTVRILVTAASGVGIYVAKSLVTFLHKNPGVVTSAVKLAFKAWGEVKDVKPGSVIVVLDCGSQEKYSEFVKDFNDGKVKDAMEEQFAKIGYTEKLELTLKERPDVAVIEMSKERVERETKKITFVTPNSEVRGDSQGADNPNKEDFQLPSQKRKQESHSTEVKQEEDSGSAAKKSKPDPVREPETSGVSSTRKKMKVKKGTPSDAELERLAHDIHTEEDSWKTLASQLKITRSEITAINEENKRLRQKAYAMLLHWKRANGSDATYKVLFDALTDKMVNCKEQAQRYCCTG